LLVGVFEHFESPLNDLISIKKIMNEDGVLYLHTHDETPNLDWDPLERISLVHVQYFTPKTIKILLQKAGFRIINLESEKTSMHVFAKLDNNTISSNQKIIKFNYEKLHNQYKRSEAFQIKILRKFNRFFNKYYAAILRRLYFKK